MDDHALKEVIPKGSDSADSKMPQYTGHLELSSHNNNMNINIQTILGNTRVGFGVNYSRIRECLTQPYGKTPYCVATGNDAASYYDVQMKYNCV